MSDIAAHLGKKNETIERLMMENARLKDVVQLAAETIIACERACWHEGQTIPGLNTEIRRIVGNFLKRAKDRGLDFESGAYGSPKCDTEQTDGS